MPASANVDLLAARLGADVRALIRPLVLPVGTYAAPETPDSAAVAAAAVAAGALPGQRIEKPTPRGKTFAGWLNATSDDITGPWQWTGGERVAYDVLPPASEFALGALISTSESGYRELVRHGASWTETLGPVEPPDSSNDPATNDPDVLATTVATKTVVDSVTVAATAVAAESARIDSVPYYIPGLHWHTSTIDLSVGLTLDGTDELTAAQAIVDAAPNGTKFLLPSAATLGLSSGLKLRLYQALVGEGDTSLVILVGTSPQNLIQRFSGNTHFAVENLKLDGRRSEVSVSTTKSNITAVGCHLVLRDVQSVGGPFAGAQVSNGGTGDVVGYRASDCGNFGFYSLDSHVDAAHFDCHDNVKHGFGATGSTGTHKEGRAHRNLDGQGIVYLHCGDGFTNLDCEAHENSKSGLVLGGASAPGRPANANWTVRGFIGIGNTQLGMTIDPTVAADTTIHPQNGSARDILVIGNGSHGLNVTHAADMEVGGLRSRDNGGDGVALSNSTNVTLFGPELDGNTGSAISVNGTYAAAGDHRIVKPRYTNNTGVDLKNNESQTVTVV